MRLWLYQGLRGFLRFLLHAWFPVRTVGTEHVPEEGPMVMAANHGSLLDPLLLIVASPRPVRFLINEDMYRSLLFGWLVRGIGCILVWRSKPVAGRLQEALDALAAGHVVGIFPEGSIVDHGAMRRLRPGVAVLLLRSGAPLVPVGIAGTVQALPFEGTLPAAQTPLCLAFGAPIGVADRTVDEALATVRTEVVRMRDSAQREPVPKRRPPYAAFLIAAVVVVPVAWLMSTASRQREQRHRARELR